MQKKTALLASTAFAALAIAAPAQAAGSGWYVSVLGGANWNQDHSIFAATAPTLSADTLTWSADGDTGFIVGGAIGLGLNQVTPGLRVEVEVAYREVKMDGVWTTFTILKTSSGTLDYDHSNFSVMANAWYDFDVAGVRPYLGGGIGWANVEADGNFVNFTAAPFSFSDDGFAWQLGAGINFDISPNMKLGFGYRYFDGPDVTAAAPFVGNGATGDLENENHTGLVSLTYGM